MFILIYAVFQDVLKKVPKIEENVALHFGAFRMREKGTGLGALYMARI